MKIHPKEVEINGTVYVPKGKEVILAPKVNGMSYVICRTQNAGVFAGFLSNREGQEVVLLNARRIWYWSGAASLSQLAVSGTSDPENCKFPVAVPEVILLQVVEIIPTTKEAKASIEGVPIWEK